LQEKRVVFCGSFLDAAYGVSLMNLQGAYQCHLNSAAKIERKHYQGTNMETTLNIQKNKFSTQMATICVCLA